MRKRRRRSPVPPPEEEGHLLLGAMACIIVKHFFSLLAEARAAVDAEGVSQDAVGVYSCMDVEGRGGCAVFAALLGWRPSWMPHAAEVPVAAENFFAAASPLAKLTVRERYIEMWIRDLVRCTLDLLLVPLPDVFPVRVAVGPAGV